MLIGYARVSTEEQSLNLQLDSLKKYGCEVIFEEKLSGKTKNRPKLQEMIKTLRKGDKVVIYKLDRLGRSTKDLIELSELLNQKEVELVSVVDQLDTSNPMGRFFFKVMASLAELERDILSERTKAGLNASRARGKVGGRPKIKSDKIDLAIKLYNSKMYSVKKIGKITGISISSIYRNLRTFSENMK